MPNKPIGRKFAEGLVRLRWAVVAAWLAAVAALFALVTPPDPTAHEQKSFLPASAPSQQAADALARYFPHNSSPSEAVVVFERRGGALTDADRRAIAAIADRLRRPVEGLSTARDLAGVYVRSPLAVPASPMISPVTRSGQAALIIVNIPANFITTRSARLVRHVRGVVSAERLPAGLSAAVTGSGAYGLDYATAAERSHHRALYVTLAAVIVILLVVYRAPVAAVIPLTAISLAAMAALKLVDLAGHLDLHTGTAERIFVVVLLYGAGIDYSLLLISRCREFLDRGVDSRRAVAAGLAASLPAILASAGTDTIGLFMLVFAKFAIFRTTGITVALALLVALLSAVTLVPALVSIAGRGLFWPGRRTPGPRRRRSRLWGRIALAVTRRPGIVMAVTLALLAVPAVRAARLSWVYDTLSSLSEDYPAVRGRQMIRRHWPIGEIAPIDVLVQADRPLTDTQWARLDGGIVAELRKVPGVRNVRSLTKPLGLAPPKGRTDAVSRALERLFVRPIKQWLARGAFVRGRIRREYLSDDRHACRLEVITGYRGQSLQALAALPRVRGAIRAAIEQFGASPPSPAPHTRPQAAGPQLKPYLAGVTAETVDKRQITHGDFLRIAALVLGVIFAMVLLLLRDALLSAFMVASTVLSYLATLGLSYWACTAFFHSTGLDWKVEVFLFVVMVAVGQDYNIFLAARLSQEGARHGCVSATRRAVIHTGPVISSCGVIMAATLGSLMSGFDLLLLVQLGFALALGMLIDTFVVRPLLLPSFAVLTRRTGRGLGLHDAGAAGH